MKYFIGLSISIFLLLGDIYSQKIQLVDKTTNEKIPNAQIICVQKEQEKLLQHTNKEGIADLTDFKAMCDSIEIRHLGYENKRISLLQLPIDKITLVELEDNVQILPSTNVSAYRFKTQNIENTQKIIQIKRNTQFSQLNQNTADMLGASGQVFIQKSQQGGGSPMIRGFSSNRLLIAVDGIRMNNAIYRSGNLQNIISLDPLSIESTEIILGPGSVMYGSDAMGGVMQFSTLSPMFIDQKKWKTKSTLFSRTMSANNELTLHGDLLIASKKWSFVSSITYSQYDHLQMGKKAREDYQKKERVERINGIDSIVANPNPYLQYPTAYRQLNILQKIAYKTKKGAIISYAFHHSETSSFGRYDRHLRYRNGKPRSAEWNYGPQKWTMHALHIDKKINKKLADEISLKAAFQNAQESRIDRNLNSITQNSTAESVDILSLNLDMKKRINPKLELFYGLEMIGNKVNSKGSEKNIETQETSIGISRYPNSYWFSNALFSNILYELKPEMYLQAGARLSMINIRSDFSNNKELLNLPFDNLQNIQKSNLNGSIGFVSNRHKQIAFSANLSSGFRAPNIDDLGKVFDSEQGKVTVPNINLKAEYIYTIETNISYSPRKNFQMDINPYFSYLRNAMVRRDFSYNGMDSIFFNGINSRVQAIQNAAQTTMWGFSLGFEWQMHPNVSLSQRINYQNGREEMDNGETYRPRHAAPTFGKTEITFQKKKLSLVIAVLYSDGLQHNELNIEERGKPEIYAKNTEGLPYSPSWFCINMHANYKIKNNIILSCFLINLSDEGYRPYSSGIVSAGRSIGASLKYNL